MQIELKAPEHPSLRSHPKGEELTQTPRYMAAISRPSVAFERTEADTGTLAKVDKVAVAAVVRGYAVRVTVESQESSAVGTL